MAALSDSERLAKMENNLARLTRAMLGDEELGVEGFVAKFEATRKEVGHHGERLDQLEGERVLEAEDRQWVKEVRTNWASPFRLFLAALGIALTAALGAIVTKLVG